MIARLVVGAAALALLGYAAGLVLTGEHFPPPGQEGVERQHVFTFVVVTVAVALLHVGACVIGNQAPPRLRTVILVAAAARLIVLFGAPPQILEGDAARLRFDARLVNQGVNPYEFKPEQIADEDPGLLLTGAQLERLVRARARLTASTDAPRPADVARPDLRTHTPPLALWFGAIADRFKPASTRGFAFLVLVADALAIFLLILALRAMRRPSAWVMIYAWSPVLLKEAYCTLSIDVFLMPALAGLILCIASGRRLLTAVPLAISASLRPALLLLLPIVGRRAGLLGVLLALILFVVPFLPFHSPDVPAQAYAEGHIHVWRHYEYNSVLENVFRGAVKERLGRAENSLTIAGVSMLEPDEPMGPLLAKILCLVALAGTVIYLIIRDPPVASGTTHVDAALSDLFIVIVALLVVSPVLHPWHVLWLLPLLAVRPNGLAWLTLPGLVCLSYLTHLEGAQAADLTLLGGRISFRVIEFGLFGMLLLLDRFSGSPLFRRAEDFASVPQAAELEPDPYELEPADAAYAE